MRQFTGEYVTNDLHILVTMLTKTLARFNAILVDDSQITPAHKLRVAVAGK